MRVNEVLGFYADGRPYGLFDQMRLSLKNYLACMAATYDGARSACYDATLALLETELAVGSIESPAIGEDAE